MKIVRVLIYVKVVPINLLIDWLTERSNSQLVNVMKLIRDRQKVSDLNKKTVSDLYNDSPVSVLFQLTSR